MSNPQRSQSLAGAPRKSIMTQPSQSSQKARQVSHLQAQLAQLNAQMADLESLVRMTSRQAQSMRTLGGYSGAMFMAASKVLGEESVNEGDSPGEGSRK